MYNNYKHQAHSLWGCAMRHLYRAWKSAFLLIMVIICTVSSLSAQQITLNEKNAPLRKVFDQIRTQSGYDFLFTSSILKNARPVSIQVKNMSVKDALDKIFEDQPLQFEIKEKTVIIKQKTAAPSTPAKTDVHGRVTDQQGRPLTGATVQCKISERGVSTDATGEFMLRDIPLTATISVSYLGFETRETPVAADLGNVVLTVANASLREVNVTVQTGYQSLPRERATGSFSYIGKEMLDKRPLPDLLGKIEGMASGLSFARTSYDNGQPKLSIRGRSTIYANDQPLLVLDGFPVEGDIRDINPNDVESITLLKDAAAASIWGTRAANGVIVITTRKGSFGKKTEIEFVNQVTTGRKPDLFYLPQMSTSDYIDLEKTWFNTGRYNGYASTPSQNRPVLSDVVHTLMDQSNGLITQQEADERIAALRNIDVRNEATDVFFRNSLRQQHQLNLRGGGDKISYYFSAGYDKILGQERGDDRNRVTLRTENTFRLLPSLSLQIGSTMSWGTQRYNGSGLKGFQGNTAGGFGIIGSEYNLYPYQRLRNADGSAAAAPRAFNQDYIGYLRNLGFEDWSYRPADELNYMNNAAAQKHAVLNVQLNYKLSPALSADLKYQYENQDQTTNNLQSLGAWYTRDLINRFSRIVPADSSVVKQLPYGDILDYAIQQLTAHNFRGQLNYNKTWGAHQLTAIAGTEVREIISGARTMRNYGYDDRTLTFSNVDYNARFNTFPSSVNFIPGAPTIAYIQDRYVSVYANAAYTYLNRYSITASGRMDDSNLFGIDPKDRNVPLWSTGLSWNIDQEPFFNNGFVSYLKLRSTYGFNGNISKTQSAYPVAVAARDNFNGERIAAVTSPGNRYLQWEKMAQWNLAVDYSILNDHISGSVEWFMKRGSYLLGDHYLDPSSGFQTIRANTAAMKGQGVDVELNFKAGNRVKWDSRLIFSYAADKITRVANAGSIGTYQYVNADKQLMPVVGRPVYAIYSFRWAGLDENGNPQLLDGNGQKGNYNTILNTLPPDQLVYNGPALPVYSGGWSHAITWKDLMLSTSFTFKAGYKFRRSSINYTSLNSNSHIVGHADYALRWQKPGDELITDVPALQPWNVNNIARDNAYLSSDILVEDASHIRWRDVSLTYQVPAGLLKQLPFKKASFYVYTDNLGIVWRANKHGIDPDFVPLPYAVRLPDVMTTTLGCKLNF